jgi:hypothetical protein
MKTILDKPTILLSLLFNSFLPLSFGIIFSTLLNTPYLVMVVPYIVTFLINTYLVHRIWKGKTFTPLHKNSWGTLRNLPYWKPGQTILLLSIISSLTLGLSFFVLDPNMNPLFTIFIFGPAAILFSQIVIGYILYFAKLTAGIF